MVHGTYFRLWPAIGAYTLFSTHAWACTDSSWPLAEKEGLKVMTRNHIHCAVGLAGEDGVVSGAS